MNKQRMRIAPAPAKLEWRTIAVTAKDALPFARDLQGALQELTDGGFTIASQMQRPEGLVIVASRLLQEESPPDTLPASAGPLRRRVVELPSARAQGATSEEVLYHYMENGLQKQRSFPTLIEALRVVKAHLEAEILPIDLTVVSMTRFEPSTFPMLLKMFAEDLPCPPG